MNNIKKILSEKEITISDLSFGTRTSYSNTHEIVNRETLDHTPLKTLNKISEYLDVGITELYK